MRQAAEQAKSIETFRQLQPKQGQTDAEAEVEIRALGYEHTTVVSGGILVHYHYDCVEIPE